MSIKFAAHLDTLPTDLTPEERFRTLARMGFTGAELRCHRDYRVGDLTRAAADAGIVPAAVATESIPLTRKDRHADYLAGLERAVAAAQTLNCRIVTSGVGDRQDDIPPDYQIQYVINGLRAAVPIVAAAGMTLVAEPFPDRGDPDHSPARSEVAADIIAEVDSPNVRMLFDISRYQAAEGNLMTNIRNYLSLIGYFRFADHPGGHQPGTGEINFVNVFRTIAESSYDGWVSAAFSPLGDPRTVLERFRREFMEVKTETRVRV